MVHSAFGYGNETVLCNDPHAQPYTCLDDTEAVEHARNSSNIHVKICRIGPWVFPVEVTTRFLPKGMSSHNQPAMPVHAKRNSHVLPCSALPCPPLPCLALPCPTRPALPVHAKRKSHVFPCPASPCPACLALPCPALPCPALN